jgi:hypothetical protein
MPNDAPLVRVFNADLGGCGHYRLIWPARADALQTLLVDKGVIAEADVVAIAAPAEEVAIKG